MKDTLRNEFNEMEGLVRTFLPKTTRAMGGLNYASFNTIWPRYGETLRINQEFQEHNPRTNAQAMVFKRLVNFVGKSKFLDFQREELILPENCQISGEKILYWEKGTHNSSLRVLLIDDKKGVTLNNLKYVTRKAANEKGLTSPRKARKPKAVIVATQAPQVVATPEQKRIEKSGLDLSNLLKSIDARKNQNIKPQVKATTPAGVTPQVKATTPKAVVPASKINLFSAMEIVGTEMPTLAEAIRKMENFTPEMMFEVHDFITTRR